jgi:hypothetical protein
MLKHAFTGTIAALALTTLSVAAKEAPAAAPAPPAVPVEIDQLDFFAGTWSCSGKAFANPMMKEHATEGTVHAARSVGKRWMHVSYEEKKSAANPMPYHAGVYMGYDSAKKTFVQNCVDNFGGYCSQSGGGWNGDTMVFEGISNGSGNAIGVRDTFTRKGANQLTHMGEMQGDDKKWNKTDEETCHKGK